MVACTHWMGLAKARFCVQVTVQIALQVPTKDSLQTGSGHRFFYGRLGTCGGHACVGPFVETLLFLLESQFVFSRETIIPQFLQ